MQRQFPTNYHGMPAVKVNLANFQIEPLWRRMVEELEPIGLEMATVHSENEAILTKKCGVASLPSLVLLIDGKHYLYREHGYTITRVVEFVRSKFPYRLVQTVGFAKST